MKDLDKKSRDNALRPERSKRSAIAYVSSASQRYGECWDAMVLLSYDIFEV